MDETAYLAEYTTELEFESIPDEAVTHAKRSILDYTGLCLYGSQHQIGKKMIEFVDVLSEKEEATILGSEKTSAPHAAFVNGVTGHAVDFDDTFQSIVLHPSCTAFPAAMAAAETDGKSGEDVLTGYIAGLDVLFRIGESVAPSHWHHGWHSTATIGVFGSAAAAGSVLDLSASEMRHGFGLAASFSSGLKKNGGSMTNPVHCGHAAQMGVVAALLARKGVTANESVFEGEYGYGEVMTPNRAYTPEKIFDPSVEWAVLDNGFKPYPSGVVTHAAMEALRSIVVEHDLAPDDVRSIIVTVDEQVIDTAGDSRPRTALEAKTSYPFCLAVVLREREVGVEEFTDEYVQENETREQMKKVEVNPEQSPFETGSAEASYGGQITVITSSGTQIEHEVIDAPGSPENPLSEDRLEKKYFDCAEYVLSRAQAEQFKERVTMLEQLDSLDELTTIGCLE